MKYLVRETINNNALTFEATSPRDAIEMALKQEIIPPTFQGVVYVYPYQEVFTFRLKKELVIEPEKKEVVKYSPKAEPIRRQSFWEYFITLLLG